MRQNQSQNQKRSRGRGRRNNNHGQSFNRNTTFESNGPEGRLRGNAQQLFEKYTALAHDANAAGERVSAEAFSQFADHYYRIHQSILQAAEQHKKAYEERRQNDMNSQAAQTQDTETQTAETPETASDAAAETASDDTEAMQSSDEAAEAPKAKSVAESQRQLSRQNSDDTAAEADDSMVSEKTASEAVA